MTGTTYFSYNLNFDKLCDILCLGKLQTEPEKIPGGFLHRMYRLRTDAGEYAVKALNPEILQRPAALRNFLDSEQIARFSKDAGFPAITALVINDTVVHNTDGQNYLVFPWIEGVSLASKKITFVHCEKIGSILAELHNINFSSLRLKKISDNKLHDIDWQLLLERGKAQNMEWSGLLQENIDNLYEWCFLVNPVATYLSEHMQISHRDLDAKNVLWSGEKPVIIDWESAGFINPEAELAETAWNWSGYNEMCLDKDKFIAFISSYKSHRDIADADWQKVLQNNFSGKMKWLEYNLNRSLGINTVDITERQLGADEVFKAIPRIKHYADMIPVVAGLLG